nr:FAD:protein FMN transferase [Actinomycetota bacterium]
MVRETPSRPGGGPGVTYLADAALPTATWSAWSCEVRVAVSDPHALRPAVAATTALMQRVDAAASRFRPDSDLSWANLNPGRPVAVSPLLVALTRSALDAAALTGGALDPTVGRDLLRLGYDRDILLVADSDHAAEARPRVAAARPTWHDVGLDEVTGLLSVPNGTRLDLGATAKAETADRAAALLHRRFGGAVLVEIGGDLAVAGERRDWQVAVGERAGGPGEQVTLGSGGLATSTTTVRAWRRGRRRMHHIVDPGTGEPAAGPWRTVSV